MLLFRRRWLNRPFIRAERRGGQAFLVVQIAHGIDFPRVTHSHGFGNFRRGNDYLVTLDHGIGEIEFLIFARKFKALEFAWLGGGNFFCDEPSTDLCEAERDLVALDGLFIKDGAG